MESTSTSKMASLDPSLTTSSSVTSHRATTIADGLGGVLLIIILLLPQLIQGIFENSWLRRHWRIVVITIHLKRLVFSSQFDHMALVTSAEVCDSNPQLLINGELRALQPIFQIYGRRQAFYGPVVTLKVFEDNFLVREFLEEKGNGRVLVVDGGGSLRCAILGGNPVVQAQNNGWAGIVVNGCIRDVDEINGCDIGVRALASHPVKASRRGIGEKHVPVTFAGTRISDGEFLYADTDGILISRSELSV